MSPLSGLVTSLFFFFFETILTARKEIRNLLSIQYKVI